MLFDHKTPHFRLVLVMLVVFNVPSYFAKEKMTIEKKCLQIHDRYLKEAYELTKNCVGFSAPVSARAYSYFSLTMYESTVEILPQLQSLTGQLNGYDRNIWCTNPSQVNWPLVVNAANFEAASYLFRNMPPRQATRLKQLMDSIYQCNSRKSSDERNLRSIEYGKQIANEIILWSKTDGGDNGFNENFPESYKAPSCPSCWTRTTPGYLTSLLPIWGKNRPFIAGSESQTIDCFPMDYSLDPNSDMYKDALELYEKSRSLDPEIERIAEYWNDSPGYSGTPTGHFFSLAQQLVCEQDLSTDRALETYVKLGIAINESFIQCWRLKNSFNLLRPITYIHRTIDPQFNTFIETPPFPEFPSGHSFQSGAGSEVLKAIFTDSLKFIDRSNQGRSDIDGSPRAFHNFTELSEEISISRFYGGIHFKTTLDTSLNTGRKIGVYVLQTLKCRK